MNNLRLWGTVLAGGGRGEGGGGGGVRGEGVVEEVGAANFLLIVDPIVA